jgi:hypothetical protein
MKTQTATAPAPTRDALQNQGSDLLHEVLAQLAHFGYRKAAIDTYRNDQEAHNVRHSYRNGEWTLACWTDGGGQIEVRYSVRATMPDIRTLMTSILPPAF